MYKRNPCFVFNVLHSIFSFIVLLILTIMLCLLGIMQESMTPMGYKIAWEAQTFERPRLTVAIAGSTCIDHSTIGCLVEGRSMINDWLVMFSILC